MVAIAIRRAVMAAAVLGLVVGAAGRARADLLITFDPPFPSPPDLTIPAGGTTLPIPNGYEGLNWSNFSVLSQSFLGSINSSNTSGIVSGTQAAFNNNGTQATLMSTGGTTFDLTSAYLTSVATPETVTVQGFRNGVMMDEDSYNIVLTPTFVNFALYGFTGIDTASFSSGGNLFVMDNLLLNGNGSAVPELDSFSTASALTLLTSGVLILNGRRKR
jgi:hypothetical protein